MNENQQEQTVYKEHIVAFLDVLGFRSLVTKNNVNKINEYFKITEIVKDEIGKISVKSDINFVTFSDSIVLVVKFGVNDDRLFKVRQFCIAISILQRNLAKSDIWLRGGISFGKLAFDKEKNIIFGPALINAYELESRHAKFPRVLLDQKFLQYLQCETTLDLIKKLNLKNNNDSWILPVLYSWKIADAEYNSFKKDYPLFIDYMAHFFVTENHLELDSVMKNIRISANETPEAYEKLRWVGDYLIATYKGAGLRALSTDGMDIFINSLEQY